MDPLDESETHAKISDSAYSNSCSNSQSRRSHSSKSTHSGSHSSGSSGYGGKPSTKTYCDNSGQPPEKRVKEKDGKKKKHVQVETTIVEENAPPVQEAVAEAVKEKADNNEGLGTQTPCQFISHTPTIIYLGSSRVQASRLSQVENPSHASQDEKQSEIMEITTQEKESSKEEVTSCNSPLLTSAKIGTINHIDPDGFSCVISMHDGVVMYTTSSITSSLGFPKDMWIGRSFIDFVHQKDRITFASHISSGVAIPKYNGMQEEVPAIPNSACTMACRLRTYSALLAKFGVKERKIAFMPFLLKLSFKNIKDAECKIEYLVIHATPFFSAFKAPNEILVHPDPFVIRHAANGTVKFIDPDSVPYLGYLPQDLDNKDALELYHPEDLPYLRQIYETIVKEGGVSQCKSYRILAQNGDFVKVVTEWSSFINPWSRKLEFVTGKHLVIEGPANPDVFEAPAIEKPRKGMEEEKNKAQAHRESIVRIMNELLTKPAEAAKQQMSKRCQDLASFMESLLEDHPKPMDEELRVEIQDPDNSYYERDSVMLGGISPHHDHNDSKSSIETPLSYNQLNYNENLQRYFDRQEPDSFEQYNVITGENTTLAVKNTNSDSGSCLSPAAPHSGDSGDQMSTSESGVTIDINSSGGKPRPVMPMRLTESLLTKHNVEMEKELMKIHRENKSNNKEERVKVVNETRKKKKEHLARCNAAFQPTLVANNHTQEQTPHGVKRVSKSQPNEMNKHHCPMPRPASRQRQSNNTSPAQQPPIVPTPAATNQWPGPQMNAMNPYVLSMGMPPPMPVMSPMGPMSGMFPMYYTPAPAPPMSTTPLDMNNSVQHPSVQHPSVQHPSVQHPSVQQPSVQHPSVQHPPVQHPSVQLPSVQHPMPCMMYGQTPYGSPFMYPAMNPPMAYPMPQNMQPQAEPTQTMNAPFALESSNYEEACKQNLLKNKISAGSLSQWRAERRLRNETVVTKNDQGMDSNSSSNNTLHRNALETASDPARSGFSKKNSEEAVDRTDGESSYSSFYSSFFKTESGSAEESGDAKKSASSQNQKAMDAPKSSNQSPDTKKMPRRKIDAPWVEHVCVTSELVYKYQIVTKSMDEVLEADKLKLSKLEQPALVNEQLAQLYLDLELEGEAARLSLEEGITSSSSSGEEPSIQKNIKPKVRQHLDYSELGMIYEEDAPFPPAPEQLISQTGPSTLSQHL